MHKHIPPILLGIATSVAIFMGTAALSLFLAKPVQGGSEQDFPQGAGIIVALGWFVFVVLWNSTRSHYPTFAKSLGLSGLVLLTVQLLDLFDIGI